MIRRVHVALLTHGTAVLDIIISSMGTYVCNDIDEGCDGWDINALSLFHHTHIA